MRYLVGVLLIWLALGAQAGAQDAVTSGNLTAAAQAVTVTLSGYGTVAVQVTGTWTGTLTFQGSVDTTTYTDIWGVTAGTHAIVTTTTANGSFQVPAAGYARVRVFATALSSGTAVVSVRASIAAPQPAVIWSNIRNASGTEVADLSTNAAPPTMTDYGLFTRSLTYARNSSNNYVEDVLATSSQSLGADLRSTRTIPPVKVTTYTLTGVADLSRVYPTDPTNGIATEMCMLYIRTDVGTGGVAKIEGGNSNNSLTLDVYDTVADQWVDGASVTLSTNRNFLVPAAGFQQVKVELTAWTSGTYPLSWSCGPGMSIPWRANVDSAAFSFGVANATAIAGVVDDTSPNAVAENSSGAVRMSTRRELYGQIRDAAGNERGANVTAANALRVDGSAVTQPVSLTSTTITGTVTVSDPTFTNATGSAVPANAAFVGGTDGTNTRALKTDAGGELQVDVLTLPALVAGTANIGDVDVLTLPSIPAGTNNIGDVDVLTLPSVTIGTFPDNEPINVAQMNGVAVTMNNGAAGTGVQRVTLASDSTGNIATIGTSVTPGTGATNLGKAEDAAHASGDVGVVALAMRNESTTLLTSADQEYVPVAADGYGVEYARIDHPRRINCNITSTAVTSAIITGCSAPGAGLSIYITSLQYSSSIISTTANFMTIQSGTGGTCGASIDVLWRGFNEVAFSSRDVVFQTPIKVPANEEVCFLHPGAGTRLVNIQGFIAP